MIIGHHAYAIGKSRSAESPDSAALKGKLLLSIMQGRSLAFSYDVARRYAERHFRKSENHFYISIPTFYSPFTAKYKI